MDVIEKIKVLEAKNSEDVSDSECEDIFFGPVTKREIISKLKHCNLLSAELLEPLEKLHDNDVLNDSLVKFYYEECFPESNDSQNWTSRLSEYSIQSKNETPSKCTVSNSEKNYESITEDLKQTEDCIKKINISKDELDLHKPEVTYPSFLLNSTQSTKHESFSADSFENSEIISVNSSPENSNISYTNSSFNCTLEDMEMFLKLGANYQKSVHDNSEIEEKENLPVCTNIIQKTVEKKECFIPPTPKTPFKPKVLKKSPNYKNIVSPVAMYIKGSPQVPLIQKITAKPVHMGTFREPSSKLDDIPGETHTNPVLPVRSYKPATKTALLSQEEEPVLPASIRKLMQCTTPRVIKHVGRVHQVPDTRFRVEEHSNQDLTLLSNSQNIEGDVSVHVSKTAARTNRLIKKH